jgi:hypothetical protein
MIRRWHIKDILIGLLTMILSVIIAAVILLVVLLRAHRGIAIGPLYVLIPILTFTAGFYWSLRRSARPKVLAKPPSTVTIIVKSTTVGVTAIIISEIAYLTWIWIQIPRNLPGFVNIDVRLLVYYWPVLVGVFLAGFLFEYRRGSKRRSMLTGGMAQ